jgi:hypothetical protein
MLQQQAMAPEQTFSYNGIQAPIPKTAGLAKILQGLAGGYFEGKADEDTKALGEKAQGEAGDIIGKMLSTERPGVAEIAGSAPAQMADVEDMDFMRGKPGGPAAPLAMGAALPTPGGMGDAATSGTAAIPARAKTTAERYADVLAGNANPVTAPLAAQMFAQMAKTPESAFGKVDPSKYTQDSVQAFMAGGARDYSILVPARKMEPVTTIGPDGRPVQQFIDPYAVKSGERFAQPLPGFMGQVQAAGGVDANGAFTPVGLKLVAQYLGKEVGELTPKDLADLRLRTAAATNQGIETEFNTGRSAEIPAVPGTAPATAPVPAAGPPAAPAPAAPAPDPTKPVPMVQSPDISRKEKQELLLKQPKETLALRNVSQNIDQTVNEINALLKEPGFNSIFGSVVGRLPTYGTQGAIAETKYNNILNKLSVSALQAMRDASATGGAVGAVSATEWPILQSQFGTIGLLTTPDDARKNFEGIVKRLMAVKDNSAASYASIYGNPSAPGGRPPLATFGGGQ